MTDNSNAQAEYQAPKPNPDLKSLDRLVGTWKLSGGAEGTTTFEWMESGIFLIQHVDLEQGSQKIKGIEIIGHLQPGEIMKKASSKGGTTKSAMPETVDDYLATIPQDAQATLEKLRKTIKAAAPKAAEVISYQIPTFKYHGPLVSFAASKNHCAFYVMSPSVMDAHKDELKPYDTAKGTIRFPAGKPLPAALVKKLVKARIAENEKKLKK